MTEKFRKAGKIDPSDRPELDRFRQTVGESLHGTRIIDNNGRLHPTAERIRSIPAGEPEALAFTDIMSLPIEEEGAWMCLPVYRDAILFYNEKDELIDGINICFECDSVETTKGHNVSTDFKTFGLLKKLLLSFGHPIENPEVDKVTMMQKILDEFREKQKEKTEWRDR